MDSLQAGTLFRERAQAKGALTTFANVEVLALETEHRRHHRRSSPTRAASRPSTS